MTNLVGQSLGRYHILEQLGEGGMATVYKARDTRLNRDVAIKVIRTNVSGPVDMQRILKRFDQEAQALAKLTHPNIVTILDYGEREGAPYLVMQYLPGGTLKERLGKPLPLQAAARLLFPIAQALAHAHQQGIIHRDIKPANILITNSGEPMLSDFGIAKVLDTEETRDLTGSGVGIGTPAYMAPEQGMGQADERSDIYALGVVFYEMLTGRVPFRADTPMATLLKKSQEPLPRPKQFAPDLPGAAENILLKALARDPANRYQTTQELAAEFERLARGELPRPVKSEKRWIWLAAGMGVLTCAVLGVGAVITLLASRGINTPETPAATERMEVTSAPVMAIPTFPTPTSEPVSLPTAASTLLVSETQINPVDGAELILIPAATFEMGLSDTQADALRLTCSNCRDLLTASQPQHTVTLDSYWIYKTEVSNEMYQRCVKAGECEPPVRYNSETRGTYYNNPEFGNYPAVFVTWFGAEKYCQWAGGHLPTEAQWEYAARGPSGGLYPWGEKLPDESLANVANFLSDTTPVDSYPNGASPFGLLNMTGNVWEWVYDWYQADYYQTEIAWLNPIGPMGADRVDGEPLKAGRGGAFWISAGNSGAGIRDWYQAGWAGSAVGFRCAFWEVHEIGADN